MERTFSMFLDHTQRRTTVGRTPLDEWIISSQRPPPGKTQHSQPTDIHAPGRIRTHNLNRRTDAYLHPRPRGHFDRQSYAVDILFTNHPQVKISLNYTERFDLYRAVKAIHSVY